MNFKTFKENISESLNTKLLNRIEEKSKEISEGLFGEGTEQLDELKASTLGSYIKKSGDHIERLGIWAGSELANHASPKSTYKIFKKTKDRKSGIDKAVDKLVKGKYTKEDTDLYESTANMREHGWEHGYFGGLLNHSHPDLERTYNPQERNMFNVGKKIGYSDRLKSAGNQTPTQFLKDTETKRIKSTISNHIEKFHKGNYQKEDTEITEVWIDKNKPEYLDSMNDPYDHIESIGNVLKPHGIKLKTKEVDDSLLVHVYKGNKKIGTHVGDWRDSAEDSVQGIHDIVSKHGINLHHRNEIVKAIPKPVKEETDLSESTVKLHNKAHNAAKEILRSTGHLPSNPAELLRFDKHLTNAASKHGVSVESIIDHLHSIAGE